MRGKLICLFGIDGSGKSSLLEILNKSKLENTICTSCIKMLSLKKNYIKRKKLFNFIEMIFFLMNLSMYFILVALFFRMYNEILPILDTGKNVILDRYVLCIKLFTELFLQPSCNCLSKSFGMPAYSRYRYIPKCRC